MSILTSQTKAYARAGNGSTSWEAAETITDDGKRGSQQYVLSYLRVHGPCIAEEIETSTTKWRASRIRTALTELDRALRHERLRRREAWRDCEHCDQAFLGRGDARFCSARCRVAAHRARKDSND